MLPENDEKTRQYFGKFTIPTNPDFKDGDAEFFLKESGSLDYTPPAVLNNYVILYTNALHELTEYQTAKGKIVGEAIERRDQNRKKLDRLKRELLANSGITTAYTKNLQLTESWIFSCAQTKGRSGELLELEDKVDEDTALIERKEREIDALNRIAARLEKASMNIQTHLSYVKKDMDLHRQHR